jgi:hypothetical protein
MPKHSVKLGTLIFPAKKEAKAYFRGMLRRYKPGDKVVDNDALQLGLLLQRHPHAKEKIGPGIKHFEVMSADFNSQCFWVVRIDETVERFSYKACIDGTENS